MWNKSRYLSLLNKMTQKEVEKKSQQYYIISEKKFSILRCHYGLSTSRGSD